MLKIEDKIKELIWINHSIHSKDEIKRALVDAKAQVWNQWRDIKSSHHSIHSKYEFKRALVDVKNWR